MSVLVDAYANPDGELSTETAEDVGLRLVGTVTETKAHSPIELMSEMVTNLQQIDESKPDSDAEPSEDDEGGHTLLGEKLDVAAIARVHHVCRGWEGKVPPNPGLNGTLDLTATLDSEGMIPTVWGAATHCRDKRQGIELELDGDIRIRLGTQSRVNLGELQRIGYLVEYQGTASVRNDNDEVDEFDLHTHFRIVLGDKVQFLVALSDGTAVVGEFDLTSLDPNSAEPMLSGGLLTRDARWSCSLNLNNASGSCTDANDPTSIITW